MIGRERGIKGLYAQSTGVRLKALRRHQGDRAKSSDIAIHQLATIIECEFDGHIFLIAGVYQQCAGEARLYDQAIPSGEIEYDEFGAPPSADDAGAGDTASQGACGDLTQHICVPYSNSGDCAV